MCIKTVYMVFVRKITMLSENPACPDVGRIEAIMQDLLKKIIEMDEQARKVEQQAKSEKLKSEEEVEKLREQIYNDYIERAKARVEKNIGVEEKRAQEYLKAYEERIDSAKKEMRGLLEANKEQWVDEIVKRSLA